MNAKQELKQYTDNCDVLCAELYYEQNEYDDATESFIDNVHNGDYILKQNHTKGDMIAFLDKLDFEYSNGYGGQELFGTIWMKDGTWMTRGEYDGSEWWEYNKCPDLPDSVK